MGSAGGGYDGDRRAFQELVREQMAQMERAHTEQMAHLLKLIENRRKKD
jgi:hypothetical protein